MSGFPRHLFLKCFECSIVSSGFCMMVTCYNGPSCLKQLDTLTLNTNRPTSPSLIFTLRTNQLIEKKNDESDL